MKNDDILVLARGLAPVVRDLVAAACIPLNERIEALERDLSEAQSVDHAPAIKAAVEAVFAAHPKPADGKDVDMAEVARMVSESVERAVAGIEPRGPDADILRTIVADEVSKLPPAEPGKPGETPSEDELRALVAPLVEAAVKAVPAPQDGKSVSVDDLRPMVEEAASLAAVEAVKAIPVPQDGKPGADGKLPIVKAYGEGVHYAGDVVTHAGGTYQASKDTGREPPHEDWVCLAAAGAAGRDADQIDICGTYDPGKVYRRLSIVALNGGAFIAKNDEPGECPGEGWQVIAMRGKPGQAVKGDPGQAVKGDPGPGVMSLSADGDGMLRLVNGDGTTVECDLYPLLSKVN